MFVLSGESQQAVKSETQGKKTGNKMTGITSTVIDKRLDLLVTITIID